MCYLEEKVLQYGITDSKKMAIGDKKGWITYGQLRTKILRWVACFLKRGIQKESIVMVQAVSDSRFISVYLALHHLNAIVVPLDRKAVCQTVKEIRQRLNVEYIVGTEKFLNGIENGISYEEADFEEPAYELERTLCAETDWYDILYTTGTTGQSKGVITTRKSVMGAIQNEIWGAQMSEKEVLLIPIPLNHSFGLGKMRAALFLGASVVLQNGTSMISDLKNNIEQYNCTAMICVPSSLEILCKQGGEKIREFLGEFHFIETASAPFGVELKKKLMKLLPNVHLLNRYGSTETPAAIYLDIKEIPEKLDSIGKAVQGVNVKIVNDDGETINSSPGDIGRLAISGPMVMEGYYGAEELTETVLADGWMYSKDMAYIDKDGYVFLRGREDDVINTGGKKISPVEIEDILIKSGLLEECAMIGIPDSMGILGMVPALAYVPVKDTLEEKDINDFLKMHVEKYKIPAQYVRMKSLPRNYMGKLERKKIINFFKV